MAESNAHKLGQFIGNLIENSLETQLRKLAAANSMYVDKQGPRKSRNNKKKVSWYDNYGNKHDLDFVIERNGTDEKLGEPIAFIECAWRRYTKHSRNKVQEIQSAILPLRDRYNEFVPFLGALLVGEFTNDAIKQLQSNGFTVLYYPYQSLIEAFSVVDIDIYWDEETSEADLKEKLLTCQSLSKQQMDNIIYHLNKMNEDNLNLFMENLNQSMNRQIVKIMMSLIYKEEINIMNIKEIPTEPNRSKLKPEEFIVEVEYTNGSTVKRVFAEKEEADFFIKGCFRNNCTKI